MSFVWQKTRHPLSFLWHSFKKMPTCNRFLPMNMFYFCAGAVRVSAPRNLLAGCPGDQQAMPQLPARRVACCFTARHRSLIDTSEVKSTQRAICMLIHQSVRITARAIDAFDAVYFIIMRYILSVNFFQFIGFD